MAEAQKSLDKVEQPRKDPGSTHLHSEGRHETAPKIDLRAAGNQAMQHLLREGVIQARLTVSQPGDASESEAERVAARVTESGSCGQVRATCGEHTHQHGSCNDCQHNLIHRKVLGYRGRAAAEASSPERAVSASGGKPLDGHILSFMETRFGTDFGDVRVHTGTQAEESASGVDAQAYTLGNDIVFGAGNYQPFTTGGQQLIAHELTHILQNRAVPGLAWSVIRRNGGSGGNLPPGQNVAVADQTAQAAGPCGVVESSLSNEGLLFQLNRARVYLTQHKRGEDQWYDYANLLRRLSSERRRRISGGHIWLAEPGLLHVPDELYTLAPGAGLQVMVGQVSASAALGAYHPTPLTLMTRAQFQRFLAFHNIPVVDPQTLLTTQDPARRSSATIELPARERSMYISPPPDLNFLGRISPFGSSPFTPPGIGMTSDPFGLGLGGPSATSFPMAGDPFGNFPRRLTYTPTAGELLRDVRDMPSWVSSGGPERVYLPRSPSIAMPGGSGSNVIMLPGEAMAGGPTSVGSLGFLGRPGVGLPSGTTGILWEGSHVVDLAVLNDRMFTRGFRASGVEHTLDFLAPELSGARARLNVGAPGAYRNDFIFPAAGEVWGRSPLSSSHWRFGSMAIVRADGSPATAQQMIELMVAVAPRMRGEYRYSPPPEGSTAFEAANREAIRRGLAGFNPAGGENCINVPTDLHRTALGGVELSIVRPDGTVIDLSKPANASARNMSEFMNQPDSFFEERGLRRVHIGQQAWKGIGTAGGLGVGMSLASDAWRSAQGEDIPASQVLIHAGIGGTTSAGSVLAEDFAYNALTTRLVSSGLSAGSASTLSRLGASTGVAIIVAPAATGLEMAFSDQEFTRSDYYARMGRSSVAAGGGALASGLFFAAMGSEVPLAGNIVGFLIGVGGYYLTDAIVGDTTEESIREGMGESGCTQGVGAGH